MSACPSLNKTRTLELPLAGAAHASAPVEQTDCAAVLDIGTAARPVARPIRPASCGSVESARFPAGGWPRMGRIRPNPQSQNRTQNAKARLLHFTSIRCSVPPQDTQYQSQYQLHGFMRKRFVLVLLCNLLHEFCTYWDGPSRPVCFKVLNMFKRYTCDSGRLDGLNKPNQHSIITQCNVSAVYQRQLRRSTATLGSRLYRASAIQGGSGLHYPLAIRMVMLLLKLL